jgi:integrase/recombinase XerD
LVIVPQQPGLTSLDIPEMIAATGAAASFAWDEFFAGQIGNPNTRKAYLHAVTRFLAWCEAQATELVRITPGMVGRYFSQHPGSIPTQKLHMAAIRGLFDVLVQRHVVILNPALSVKTQRYSVTEGKTPAISVEQARALLASIELRRPVDYRDRALLATLIYTTVRVSAAAKLKRSDFVDEGMQYALRFSEKGGKSRIIPVRHDLQGYL